ncbi:hypothetical protein N7520_003578 [Penicillium odoratum]|uniref:uncharacterized protein n=1 Tax=Penicillium odoratum TaxID=1167516 RepID=UPI0025472CA6|nr:uncharacterized protein N7520_003578 [Penicillium odoratum]KAJ5769019.1 hypothetical protein N7520_003578 [Penicillium odoratum]
MEPVSFAVGIIGLAGLFSTCLDVLDKVDSRKDFGSDSQNLSAQFKAHKLRLERWGKAVGFENGGVSDVHDKTLDDPHVLSAVKDLLTVVKDVCHIKDDVFSPSQFTPDTTGKHVLPRRHTRLDIPKGPKMQKLNWALRDRAKRVNQVGNFAALVDILYSLVPVGGERGFNGFMENQDGESFDRVAFNAQLVDIVSKIQSEMEAETMRDMQRRINGTCEWILSAPWFHDWQSSDLSSNRPKVLWLNAPAGFGKSILCARVVDYLSSALSQPTCNFFFSTDLEREDHFVAIRNWLSQMISHPTAYGLIHELWSAQQGVKATRHEITNLLRDVARAVPGCTFTLDGLDECIRRAEHQEDSIAGFLNTIRRATAGTPTRLLIVSRDEPEIRSCFSEMEGIFFTQHKITPDDVQADIEIYSRSVVDRKLAKKTETIRQDISQQLSERCNGQFLWIKLQENDLRSTANQKALQRIINSTPVGLEDAYQRNWKRISQLSDEYRARSINILRWTAFAVRPLTVNEMVGALLVAEDNDEVLLDEIPDEIDEDYIEIEILKDCNSLLEIRMPQSGCSAGVKSIHLAHFSVKEYLLQVLYVPTPSQNLRLDPISQFSVDGIQSILLGKMCLRYLNCQAVWESMTEEYQLLSYFRNYAAESWQQHTVEDTKDAQLTKLIHNFFDEENPTWRAWKEWFDSNYTDGNREMENDANPLPTSAGPGWYAAYLGMHDVVQSFLRISNDGVEDKGIGGLTALGVACSEGQLEIAKMLLRAGADVENATNKGQILISFAIGNLEIVKLLLENGADIESAEDDGWNALHFACNGGYLEVMRLLLDAGADIHATTNDGTTALIITCRQGHLEMAKLFLGNGANIEAATNDGTTALITACCNGHLEVVRLLLDTGADISAATKDDGTTALNTACRNGHLEVVRLLLDTGVNIEVATNDGTTALIIACCNGHLEVVRLLLDTGVDIEATDKYGLNVLYWGCALGHLEMVRLLLDTGADIEAATNYGTTALITACRSGYLEVVRLLLDTGADIEAATNYGKTALSTACRNGQLEVVRLLLDAGADVEAADPTGWNALITACSNGNLEVVRLLLDTGADIEAATNYGTTALNTACRNGHLEVVRLLLDAGADITANDPTGWNALITASAEGHLDLVKLLLDNGAKFQASNRWGRTALFFAASHGQKDVVRLFLANYISLVDLPDTWGSTPLFTAVKNGHSEVVLQLILVSRLTVTTKDNLGKKCFELGAQCLDPDHEITLQEPEVLSENDIV